MPFAFDDAFRKLYEGKLNFIVDRFVVKSDYSVPEATFALVMKDFGGNVHRTHRFTTPTDLMAAANFLRDWNLVCENAYQIVEITGEYLSVLKAPTIEEVLARADADVITIDDPAA